MTKDEARALLRDHGLRLTGPRIAVLRVLSASAHPLAHTQVLAQLPDADFNPTTVYRTLVKLREAGLATVASRAEGLARYALTADNSDPHRHAHFVCDDCGEVSCLPEELIVPPVVEGPWSKSIGAATVQLRGECPDCLDS